MKMDTKKSKSEMLAKIAAMKQELAKKEKKLKKSLRVASIKAHVQQKLKEVNSPCNKEEGFDHHLEGLLNTDRGSGNDEDEELPTPEGSTSSEDVRSRLTIKGDGDGPVMTSTKGKYISVKTESKSEDVLKKKVEGLGDGSVITSAGSENVSRVIQNSRKKEEKRTLKKIRQAELIVLSESDNIPTDRESFSHTLEKNLIIEKEQNFQNDQMLQKLDPLAPKSCCSMEEKLPVSSGNILERNKKHLPESDRFREEKYTENLKHFSPEIQTDLNKNKIASPPEWENSGDNLNFESQLIPSTIVNIGGIKEDGNKSHHDISNSQFLELLELSQPISLTPKSVEKENETVMSEISKLDPSVFSEYKAIIGDRNSNLMCVQADDSSQNTASHVQQLDKTGMEDHKNDESASPSTLYEYTELDAISYSQFELTEDFLSENVSTQSDSTELKRKVKRPSCLKSLIKRKSPRLSAISHSLSRPGPFSQSSSSESAYISKNFGRISQRKGQHLEQEKAVAILSAFQYLIEEAKRQANREFELPCSFRRLISQPKKLCLFKCKCAETQDLESPLGQRNSGKNDSNLSSQNGEEGKSDHDDSKNDKDFQEIPLNSETNSPGSIFSSPWNSQDTSKPVRNEPQPHSVDDADVKKTSSGEILELEFNQERDSDEEESLLLLANGNSCAKVNPRFISNDSLCSKIDPFSPISQSVFIFPDQRVKIKSAKMSQEDFSNNHNKLKDDIPSSSISVCKENAEAKGDSVSLRESRHDNSAMPSKNMLSLKKDLDRSNVIHPNLQESYKSPKTNEIFKEHFSPYHPSSSSTPISNMKSRLKMPCENTREGQQFFDSPEILSLHDEKSSQGLNVTKSEEQHERNHNLAVPKIDSCSLKMSERNDSFELFNATNSFNEDSLPSGQNTLKDNVSMGDKGDARSICDMSLPTSPISKWSDEQVCPERNHILPWKTISRTPFTPLRVLEKENSFTSPDGFPSPTFIYGQQDKRGSLPRPTLSGRLNGAELKGRTACLYFAGCFQSCSEDSVVELLHCEIQTDQNVGVKVYLVSVQASALTVWAQDVDGCGWVPELDWRLSPNIHILAACSLPQIKDKISIAAYGWEDSRVFATIFVYDINDDVTNRFNLPVVDENKSFKNLREIHFCSTITSHLLMGISGTACHTIRSVWFKDGVESLASTSLFKSHRGTLLALVVCPSLPKACFGLTGDQKIVIWNIELGAVLKSIELTTAVPCLTSLLAVATCNGFLILTASWRGEKSDCGGILLLNPVTGKACKYCVYKNPNSGWKSTQAMKVLNGCVVAVSSTGSVCWWNHTRGNLIGHRKANNATCATLIRAKSVLIGEVQGCVHIYSQDT